MVQAQSILTHIKPHAKLSIFIVAGLLLLVWGLDTPPGILGKADGVGYAVCHRIDLRSFHIGVRQLPLCARCTGQYVGAILGLLFQACFARKRSGFPPKRVLAVLGILCLIYIVDGLNSYLYLPPFLRIFPALPHLYAPSNLLRLVTGTAMGLVIAVVLYPAFVGSIYARLDTRPAISGLKPLFAMIVINILVDLLILNGSSYVLYSTALISAGGVIVLLSLAYTVVILRIFRRENKYTRLSQVGLPLIAGFVFTMFQIATFDLIRFMITGTWGGLVFG